MKEVISMGIHQYIDGYTPSVHKILAAEKEEYLIGNRNPKKDTGEHTHEVSNRRS